MIPGGSQTPINTDKNRTSNRFRTERNENRQERRRNHANFNEFLGELYEKTRAQVKEPFTQELIGKWLDRVEMFTF